MKVFGAVGRLALAALVISALLASFAVPPAVASRAAGVTVRVSIAPCARIRPDGTFYGNIPLTAQPEGGLLVTVAAR